MPKTHRNRPPSYPIGAMPEAPSPAPAEEPPEDSRRPPAASATKTEWAAYAAGLGVATAGMTKQQIRKAVG